MRLIYETLLVAERVRQVAGHIVQCLNIYVFPFLSSSLVIEKKTCLSTLVKLVCCEAVGSYLHKLVSDATRSTRDCMHWMMQKGKKSFIYLKIHMNSH